MSIISQEITPEVATSAASSKKMNAEVVTTMTMPFLKRLGHKSELKPKRVSLDGDDYT